MRLFKQKPPSYADGQRIAVAGFTVRLRVSRRARAVSLRIDPVRGEVVASAPSERRLSEAVTFATSRAGWIARRLASAPQAWTPAAGEPLALFGEPHRLVADGRRPRVVSGAEGRSIVGCGAGEIDPGLVARAVKSEARAWFAAALVRHCGALGVAVPWLGLSDPRTRWGSCAPARRDHPAAIRLSWRLALAPFAVADYVVAHECAHLIEANHGPEFWRLVVGLVGEAAPHREWLKREGARLHRFGRG